MKAKKDNIHWSNKQKIEKAIHQIPYRGSFKPSLVNFLITKFSKEKEIILDPFSGRGTTGVEANLLNRKAIFNDTNKINFFYWKGRQKIPSSLKEIEERIEEIDFKKKEFKNDFPMFFHKKTWNELQNWKFYFFGKEKKDYLDYWIMMVVLTRLVGHSNGFFSVRTMPPNISVTSNKQIILNQKHDLEPIYKNFKEIILKKSKSLLKDIEENIDYFNKIANYNHYYNFDSRKLYDIKNDSVDLVITSPPFLNVINYYTDNWMKMDYLNIPYINDDVIFITSNIEKWNEFMKQTIVELSRVTKKNKMICIEVGEIKKSSIFLEENIIAIVKELGLKVQEVIIQESNFTKTSNTWGILNNKKGTNTNRIVVIKNDK